MPPNQNSTNDDPSGAPKKNSNTDEQDNESNHSEEVVDPDTTEKVSKKNDRSQGSKKTTKRPGKCPRCGNRVIKTVNQAESTYSCKASGIDGVKNVNKVTTCGHCGKFTTSPDSVEDSSAHQTEKKSCTHCGKTIPKEGAVPVSSKTKVCPGCGRPVTAIDQGDKDAAGAAIIGGAVAGAEVLEERPSDGSDEVTPGTENVEEDTDLQKEDAVLIKEDEDLKKDEEEDLQKEDENLQKESEDLREGTEDLQEGTEDLQTEDTTIEDIEADERDKSSEKVAPTRESFSDKQVKFDVDVRVVEESDDISDSKDESEDIKTESELEKEIEPVLEVLTELSDAGDGIQEGRGEPHSPSELSVEQWPNVENMEAPE